MLFEKHPALNLSRPIYLVEEFLYFRIQTFHKQRLILLRASMKEYANFLTKKGFVVFYIDSIHLKNRQALSKLLQKKGVKKIHLCDFSDEWLKQDLQKGTKEFGFELLFYSSPMFLTEENEFAGFFKKKKFFMADFYKYQRKKLNILMEEEEPVGGKFSFDDENRKKLPKGCEIPRIAIPEQSLCVREAITYIENEFPSSLGESSPFLYQTTFSKAKKALSDFIENRFRSFGEYEDAISREETFLFHSVLSPLLNIGLLTPSEVVSKVLFSYEKRAIPLNSVEGFIRQIIGWREFMRGCYLLQGKSQRISNYFNHTRSVPKGFWDGTTGIDPVDVTIKKILKTGYCHHIERLMILGNFLLLTETDPNHVYEWFMSFFVDAYDWVMVPNVYGMSQYSDKGTITTKPYISGSNYILKMSNYSKGGWVDVWDGLFWRFLSKHKDLFSQNPRTKILLGLLDKNKKTIAPKILLAEKWLQEKEMP